MVAVVNWSLIAACFSVNRLKTFSKGMKGKPKIRTSRVLTRGGGSIAQAKLERLQQKNL